MLEGIKNNCCTFFKQELSELKAMPKSQIAVGAITIAFFMVFSALFAYCLLRSNAEYDLGMRKFNYIDAIGISSLAIGLPLTGIIGGILLHKTRRQPPKIEDWR